MSYLADYELTALGDVKVQNYVTYVDKRNGYVVMEFDARGKDWVNGAPYPQAFLRYSGADKTTIDLTDLSNAWKRYRIKWLAGSELDNKDWGDVTFTLKIHDDGDVEQTFDMAGISLDLDPVEFSMDILQDVDFGYVILNGVKFTESTAFAMNHADAGKAYWHEATNYLVDTPALATGNNSYSIDLVCRNI